MWEQIRANKRRSALLIAGLALLLASLGFVIGQALGPDGGPYGLAAAVAVWVVLWLTAILGGRQVLLLSAHARPIGHEDAPQLDNVVEEMTIAAGLPRKPRTYIIDNDAPNAFAVGTPDHAAVAVTTGLLIRLNRDELQGVIAHEIGHIKNQDTRFMTQAGVMVAAIVLVADLFLRGLWAGAGTRRGRGKGGGGQALFLLIAILFALLAPLAAQVLYFACSRRREYLADACAARFTRYPEGLASALEKISHSVGRMRHVNRATAPMYIVNPLKGSAGLSLFRTHPPTRERIRVLRSMGNGAAYADYEQAYSRVCGGKLIGRRSLAECGQVGVRPPTPEPKKDGLTRAREAVDILHRAGGLLFLTCACGLKMKIPPSYKQDTVHCPRCGRETAIPVAAMAAAGALARAAEKGEAARPRGRREPAAPPTYRLKPGQWQSFRCTCGHTIQLSPAFSAPHVRCPRCKRETLISRP